jgi:hypothetical protein
MSDLPLVFMGCIYFVDGALFQPFSRSSRRQNVGAYTNPPVLLETFIQQARFAPLMAKWCFFPKRDNRPESRGGGRASGEPGQVIVFCDFAVKKRGSINFFGWTI